MFCKALENTTETISTICLQPKQNFLNVSAPSCQQPGAVSYFSVSWITPSPLIPPLLTRQTRPGSNPRGWEGGQWLAGPSQRKETSGSSSRGSEGADVRATRVRSVKDPGEDVSTGRVGAWGDKLVRFLFKKPLLRIGSVGHIYLVSTDFYIVL